jgi:hypothetical protein
MIELLPKPIFETRFLSLYRIFITSPMILQ